MKVLLTENFQFLAAVSVDSRRLSYLTELKLDAARGLECSFRSAL